MLVAGRVAPFVALVLTMAVVLWQIGRARAGDVPTVKPLRPLQAIEEAVGRATEMGRPVAMIPGCGGITDGTAIETLAGLEILSYVASMTARYDARLRVIINRPDVYPLALEKVRQAYAAAGRRDAFDPESQVLFMSGDFFAYIMGAIGLMQREKVAGAIMTGFFTGDTTLVAEGAALAGALTVAGLLRVTHVAYFVVQADYTLIGEEMLVAGAVVSGDAVKLGSIRAQDIVKAAVCALIVGGVVMASLGQASSLVDLLRK